MKQTTLDLNGPILSFTTNPENVLASNAGIATFVGIATATFPTQIPANSAIATGSISYQWYDSNLGRLSDSTNITGTGTSTLTLSNLISPTDHKRQVYVIVDYIPSAYQSSSPITAGTGRSTGNAINPSIKSRTAIVSVRPQISIATQPIGSFPIENTNASISVVASSTDTSQGTFLYQWSLNGVKLTDSSTVSGSTTSNLTISRPLGIYTLQVKISNPFASNSPIFSDNVNIEFISPRRLINTELYNTTSSTAVLNSQDLLEGEITLVGQNQTNKTSLISLYAPEININVEMDIYSGSGIGGAQGGYSRIRFLMIKNEEYTIAGLDSFNNCPFIYRKGTLIAVCGKGGDSSSNGSGGNGGGINVAGAPGSGRGGGSGGSLIVTGILPSNGIFGSSSSLTPISPDTKSTGQTGGRALPCPKGNYWLSKGKSPCSDVGISQIYLANGTLVTNSASITRGFKSGYDIRETGGQGQNGVNPPPILNPQTCTRRVSQTSVRRIQSTCIRRVSQTSTRLVPRTSTRLVPQTSTRLVPQTSYTPVVTVTPDPIYVPQTSYTPVVTVTPDPVLVPRTSYTPVVTITPDSIYVQQTSYTAVLTLYKAIVNFNVTRDARYSNYIDFTVFTSNTNDPNFTMGPNAGTRTLNLSPGTEYTLSGRSDQSSTVLWRIINSQTIGLEDGADGDYNDLMVTVNVGEFSIGANNTIVYRVPITEPSGAPLYVPQTSTRTVAVYSDQCGVWAFECSQGGGDGSENVGRDAFGRTLPCANYDAYCPEYVSEEYDSSYYIYPESYTTGGDAYDSSYYIYFEPYTIGGLPYDSSYYLYFEPYTTGGDAYDSSYYIYPASYTTGGDAYNSSYYETYDTSYTETYDTSYTETYDSSYDQPYDCSYDENYDSSYDETYDCSYLSYPPTPAAGGNGGAGATGGSGGTDSCGGGGGSGYTDGSVTVVSTQLGGSTGFSKIAIRLV